MAKKSQKINSTSKTKTSNSDGRIKEKTYTVEDILFIARRFMEFGINIQSIIQVQKEQAVCEEIANANNLQMQDLMQIVNAKEKSIDAEDLYKKLAKIENIEVAIKYPDVFQISIIEKLK